MDRQFDAKTHKYSVNGNPYVGVNELLVAEGLSKDLSKIIPADKLAYCCERGNTVHKIAELTLKGTLNPESIDDRLIPYKQKIDRFLIDYAVKPLHIETILWDDVKMFAGKTDLIAETNKGLAIVDWSSGQTNHYLQLHAYKLLTKAFLNLDIEVLIDVSLKGKVYRADVYKPDRKTELVILSALLLYNYKKEENGKSRL